MKIDIPGFLVVECVTTECKLQKCVIIFFLLYESLQCVLDIL